MASLQKCCKSCSTRGHGINALKEINLRILELESRNQPEAVRLWQAIRKSVESLLEQQDK